MANITPTEYERQRYDLGYGFRTGNHTLQLDYGYNDTGDSGTRRCPWISSISRVTCTTWATTGSTSELRYRRLTCTPATWITA